MGLAAGLYWEEHGAPDAPAVLLSAGLGGSASYWAPNVGALAAGHRVILYDHRGTGRSERGLPDDHDAEAMAADAASVLDAAGVERAVFVGHALGGIVGMTLALRAPGRLSGLVIVNGFARADGHFHNCMETRLALLHGAGALAFVRAQPIFLYPSRWIADNFDRLKAEEEGHLDAFQGAETLETRIDLLRNVDLSGRLGEIATPTLVVAAEDDMLVAPQQGEALAAGIAGAELERMTGGHGCNVSQAGIFNEKLRSWLGRLPDKGA